MTRIIGEHFEMPNDQPGDGVLSQVMDVEEARFLLVSEAEAAKLLGCLSLFLGIRINQRDAKQIRIGPPAINTTTFTFHVDRP